jgi:hypothetical protein
MGVSGQRHAPAALCPRGKDPPGTHCTGGWVGPRAGADTEVRGKILLPLPEIEPLSPGSPVRSQTDWLTDWLTEQPRLPKLFPRGGLLWATEQVETNGSILFSGTD